jgi:hypothetical protein
MHCCCCWRAWLFSGQELLMAETTAGIEMCVNVDQAFY